MAERQQKISDGLAAADRASHDLELAQKRANEEMADAKREAAGTTGVPQPAHRRCDPHLLQEVRARGDEIHQGIDAFRWCPMALQRASKALGGNPELVKLVAGRRITTSSAYSGAGTDVTCDGILTASFQNIVDQATPSLQPSSFQPVRLRHQYEVH